MDGSVRVYAAVTTDLVNEAFRIHRTFPTATAALGRTLTAAAIMGAQLKNDTDSVTIQFSGDGPLGSVIAVSDNKSRVRGYVSYPFLELPLNDKGKLDVAKAVGKGFLSVVRDLSMKEPYTGQVPIVSGEIAEDLTYYFAKSEQIPTAMGLGVLVDKDHSVLCSGGFMIQLMPEATEETAERLEEIVKSLPPVTQMISDGMTAEDIFFRVTDGFDMLMENNHITPLYECKCTHERMERALISIGREELQSLIDEQGEAELTCRFCDRKYTFSREELEKLMEQAKG